MDRFNQVWAVKALERVQQVATNQPKKYCRQYGSTSHSLPVLVRTAGLAQALAFVEGRDSREGNPYYQLLDDLAFVLRFDNREKLLEASRTADLDAYMYLTRQVLGALLWFKRYAQSVLNVQTAADAEGIDGEAEEQSAAEQREAVDAIAT